MHQWWYPRDRTRLAARARSAIGPTARSRAVGPPRESVAERSRPPSLGRRARPRTIGVGSRETVPAPRPKAYLDKGMRQSPGPQGPRQSICGRPRKGPAYARTMEGPQASQGNRSTPGREGSRRPRLSVARWRPLKAGDPETAGRSSENTPERGSVPTTGRAAASTRHRRQPDGEATRQPPCSRPRRRGNPPIGGRPRRMKNDG